jgi:hypothetical protein
VSKVDAWKLRPGDCVRTSSGKIFSFEHLADRNAECGVFKNSVGVTIPLMIKYVERVRQ